MGHATTLLLVSDLHRSLAVEGDRRRVPAPQTRAAQASPNLVRRSTKSVRTDSERGRGSEEGEREHIKEGTYGLESRRGIGGGGPRRALALALLG